MTAQATVHELRTQATPAVATPPPALTVGFDTLAGFELTQRVATMFSKSSLMPKDFVGNVANCAIALNMAARMGADPLMVAQNLYVVYGRPGWSAKFLIATFNSCGRFSAIRYEFDGLEGSDEWRCRAWAVEKATNERVEGAWVSIGLAKDEGWYQKNGSKWQTMPMQMLMYRSASWFINAYAPEIAMGLQTVEEVRDTWDMQEDTPGVYTMTTEEIQKEALSSQDKPKTNRPTAEERAAKIEAELKGEDPQDEQQASDHAVTVLCPNKLDSDGNPVNVLASYCDGCTAKEDCPAHK